MKQIVMCLEKLYKLSKSTLMKEGIMFLNAQLIIVTLSILKRKTTIILA